MSTFINGDYYVTRADLWAMEKELERLRVADENLNNLRRVAVRLGMSKAEQARFFDVIQGVNYRLDRTLARISDERQKKVGRWRRWFAS